jgi:lysozyme family protein
VHEAFKHSQDQVPYFLVRNAHRSNKFVNFNIFLCFGDLNLLAAKKENSVHG